MQAFIARHRVRMTAERADKNPHITDMAPGSTHWQCCLRAGSRQMTVFFSMGPALAGKPQAADVLECLASDAAGFENASNFEDWAREYGYDPDSRKAERTYRAVEKQTAGLKRLFSEPAYEDLTRRIHA